MLSSQNRAITRTWGVLVCQSLHKAVNCSSSDLVLPVQEELDEAWFALAVGLKLLFLQFLGIVVGTAKHCRAIFR